MGSVFMRQNQENGSPMIEHVTAAAPRFLLRLFALDRLFQNANVPHHYERMGEVGAGLGDVASYIVDKFDPDRIDLFESFNKTRNMLQNRFSHDQRVMVRETFAGTDAEYDLMLCFEVVEHIEDDETFVRQLFSSLRANGLLVGSVPAYPSKWQAVDRYAGHVRRYTPEDMQGLLKQAGFEEISVEVYGFPLTNLLYLPRQLYYGRREAGCSANARLAATHDSGISRDLVRRLDKRIIFPVVRSFAMLQFLPIFRELGDGLLFSARRIRKDA